MRSAMLAIQIKGESLGPFVLFTLIEIVISRGSEKKRAVTLRAAKREDLQRSKF
jgi:hypothetical protein